MGANGVGVWGLLGNLTDPSDGMQFWAMSQSTASLAMCCFASFLRLNITVVVIGSGFSGILREELNFSFPTWLT
jgi:hypothetical protein